MDLNGATILLTGGTGSFGRAFIDYAIERWPNVTIRVYSRDELKQSELRSAVGEKNVRYLVGDVRDRSRLTRAATGATHLIHAAAMKQVPACEYNPFEAVQTNILGAENIVAAAIANDVPRLIQLSTDKAVNPVNLYGATKLCAEKIVVQGNAYAAHSTTRLACVRYGNVIGSRGSVVPLFKQQRAEGKLTITDGRMTRFWITLDQAVELVLHALEHMQGGEVFVPKIPSMRVTDLADVLAPGVPREEIGIRPGEKLHEALLTTDEARHTLDAKDVYVVLPELPSWPMPAPLGAIPVADDFVYTSDQNDDWLDAERLAQLLS
jgi:UDP-N-acetylglucosamine 4,6-dehydratase